MSTISAATDFAYISNNSYLLIAKGGDLTVQRYDENGALTTVAGSPVLDGEEKTSADLDLKRSAQNYAEHYERPGDLRSNRRLNRCHSKLKAPPRPTPACMEEPGYFPWQTFTHPSTLYRSTRFSHLRQRSR